MDVFHHLEDLGEVAFDVGSRGVGLDDQTGLLEQFVRARWTSRRTETPAPIGIAWISAVAFMGLEVKGLTWFGLPEPHPTTAVSARLETSVDVPETMDP